MPCYGLKQKGATVLPLSHPMWSGMKFSLGVHLDAYKLFGGCFRGLGRG